METVISCQQARTWTAPDGAVKPVFGIGLSDGRGGESFKEIPVGTPASELIIEPNGQYPPKIKWNKPGNGWGGGGGGKRERGGNESFALAYAKDLVVGGKVDIKQILGTADKLYNWLESKRPKPASVGMPATNGPAPKPQALPATAPVVAQVPTGGPTDDLPF